MTPAVMAGVCLIDLTLPITILAMNLTFDYLANQPALLPELASWFYEEWGRRNPENSIEKVEQRLQERMNRDTLPIALVGFLDGKLVASASVKIQEMETHPHYEHWLGAVYVDTQYRNRKLGSQIVQYTVAVAKQLGVKELYLYTRSHEDFYTRLGWLPIERPQYHGRLAVVMKQTL